jgi:repressor LexA
MELPDPTEPPDKDLTPRRRKIMKVIDDSVRRHGYSPSLREIGDAVGLASTSSVSHQVLKLQKLGLVSREPGRPRTILVRPPNEPAIRDQDGQEPDSADGNALADVRYAGGRIAAGGPILAEESAAEIVRLPRWLVGHGDLIMLNVVGDSMTGAAITDGDRVVVRRQPCAENGDIVAAMLDSGTPAEAEATVKTYRKRDGHVWLMPHNPAYDPIPGDNATIVGKVVAVLRRTLRSQTRVGGARSPTVTVGYAMRAWPAGAVAGRCRWGWGARAGEDDFVATGTGHGGDDDSDHGYEHDRYIASARPAWRSGWHCLAGGEQ